MKQNDILYMDALCCLFIKARQVLGTVRLQLCKMGARMHQGKQYLERLIEISLPQIPVLGILGSECIALDLIGTKDSLHLADGVIHGVVFFQLLGIVACAVIQHSGLQPEKHTSHKHDVALMLSNMAAQMQVLHLSTLNSTTKACITMTLHDSCCSVQCTCGEHVCKLKHSNKSICH